MPRKKPDMAKKVESKKVTPKQKARIEKRKAPGSSVNTAARG